MQLVSRYSELRESARVHERALFPVQRTPSELELQARWFAGDFGRRFVSVAGDQVEIVQFGTWNREAGPDFSDAVVRLNAGDPMRGTIEFDLADRSWETHGHSTNPAFDDAVLHVFVQQSQRLFFTRTKSHRNVPQVRVDPAGLPDKFSANVPLARPGRCQAPLKDLSPEHLGTILTAAAQFRLQRKAARIKNIVETHGREAALFQEIAGALGYKQNKLAFTLLAQRLPLSSLRKESDDIEALLFGVAGFLQSPDLAIYPPGTRAYVRKLWDRWWPHRDEIQRLVLPTKLWHLGGARPMNHPQRRLGALAILAKEWPSFIRSLARQEAKRVHDFFVGLRHPFWNLHYTLTSDAAASEMAIVGDSRIAEILANVLLPCFLAEGSDIWLAYEKLPARLTNRRLETGATRLFGDDPRRARFTKTIAQQQGLLQIYEDFCLQDNSDCAECPFPEQLQKWKFRAQQHVFAFTLVELLVVIAIVAVLLGLAFPVFQGVQNQARKTQAKNDLVQIVTAVNAFYTEYGKYPLVTADKTYGPAADPNDALFNVLRARNAAENPRQIIFIAPPDTKSPAKPRSGIGTEAGTLGQFFDPWGIAYQVRIDGNYDNQLTNPYSANAGSATLQAGVIAWSFGSDTLSETAVSDKNAGKNKDDVISWQ